MAKTLAVIILTYNEEKHIARCINSLKNVADEVFVIDSYSTDQTVAISKSLGAIVCQNPWKNYATQFNWALKNCPITTSWIMRLDADEYLTPELCKEINNELNSLSIDITGIILNYRHYFQGKWIKHGTRYPLPLLRIWRKGKGTIENKWMDERIVLTEGKTVKFKSDFIHDDLNDIAFLINKHNGYATREAIDLLNREYRFMNLDFDKESEANKSHLNLYFKNSFYCKSPLFLRCFIYFTYRYFIRFGFLDGKPGLIYHFLQGFWYRFLVDAKIYELKHRFNNDKKAIVNHIITTYQIT